MQIVVAAYGSRGDVEPCAAVALELLRRDHDVRMAVPPNLLGFIESAGLAGVAYGPDSREEWNPGSDLVRNIAPRMQNPISVVPEVVEHVTQVKVRKGAELSALAKGISELQRTRAGRQCRRVLRRSGGCAAPLPGADLVI